MLRNRSCPNSTVIPELPYDDVTRAADWLCEAFGFTVRLRIGNHRCQINIGDGAMVVVEREQGRNDVARVMVRVENVDAHCKQAREHGAVILREPADYPYGEALGLEQLGVRENDPELVVQPVEQLAQILQTGRVGGF